VAVSAPKEYNLGHHYETLHKDKFGVLEGRLRENKLKNLKCDLQWQQNISTIATKTNEATVQASFIISQIIAKKSQPFMDGEYVKECIMKATEILCPEKQQLFKNISLSANMVAQRVNDLAGDIQCQLKEKFKNFVAYSIAIDESTDVKDIAQLAVFVRGVNEDFEYGEIIYRTNVRWLRQGSVLKQFFDLLDEIKLFMEKKGRNIEELNDEGWITDLAFLVDVTGHLNNLNKELHGKDKLITDMYNNIMVFKSSFDSGKNQLKQHNFVHFPHLKSLDTIFPERIQ
jgi:hypothetical protein